jgi:hypothetical protein
VRRFHDRSTGLGTRREPAVAAVVAAVGALSLGWPILFVIFFISKETFKMLRWHTHTPELELAVVDTGADCAEWRPAFWDLECTK